MRYRIFYTITFLFSCLFTDGCVAVSKREYWRWTKIKLDTISTKPYVTYIDIHLIKEQGLLPLPLIGVETNRSKGYMLDIDLNTKSKQEYQRLDSIQYSISTLDNKLISAGVLPIRNGEVTIRWYSPGDYRAQCTTAPSISIGKQKQELKSNFIIYATAVDNQSKCIYIDNTNLRYYKPRIVSFF